MSRIVKGLEAQKRLVKRRMDWQIRATLTSQCEHVALRHLGHREEGSPRERADGWVVTRTIHEWYPHV